MALNTIKASNIEDGTVAGIDFLDNSLSSDNIAALSSSKLSGALPALNGSALTGLTSANLVGALPALDGTALTGIVSDFTPLTNSMARLALHIGAVEQLAKFNMIDQVVDDYEDATGVDASASTYELSAGSAGAKYYHSHVADSDSGWVTLWDVEADFPSRTRANSGTWASYTMRMVIPASEIPYDLIGLAVTVRASTSEGIDWLKVHAGEGTTTVPSNSTPSSEVTFTNTPTEIKNGSGNSGIGNPNANGSYESGLNHGAGASYAHDATKNLIIAWDMTLNSAYDIGNKYSGGGINTNLWYSDTVNSTHYSGSTTMPGSISGMAGTSFWITKIRGKYTVPGSTNPLTLVSTTTTAQSTATKANIVLQTQDATGTATINTDVKAGVSRDALNYVDTTLAKISTWGSGNVYAANDVTIPGTVMTKIITVAASKLVTDGTSQATLTLTEGYTYKFDTSDSTLSGHTFSFATAADAAGSTQYTTGVTTNGTPGNAGAYTQIVVAASAPTLYYYCANHATMGGTANTPAEAATTSMRYKVETKNQTADIIAVNNDLANGTNADYNNYTFRQIIPASVFSSNQTKIQIKFRAGSVYPNHFVNTYVGHKASSGNAWDYESAPTRITWGGGNNQTNIGNGTTATSDVITFALDSSKDLILAIDFSSGGNQQGVNYKAVGSTGWTGYAKGNYSGDSSNGAVATAPSGYSADNNIYGFDQIIFPGKITRVHGTSLAWS